MSVQAPRTVGPNLAELTMREQAAEAWAKKSAEERHKAERAAINLARTVFGNAHIEFDEFVPADFARRHHYQPRELVTFEIEGLEFNYRAAMKDYSEFFWLIDNCPCGRGPRLLAAITTLADIGRAYEWDFSDEKCQSCKDDEKKAAKA